MAELNELLDEAAVRSGALSDEIEETEAGIRSLIDHADQLSETIVQETGQARQRLSELTARLAAAQGELDRSTGDAAAHLDGLEARAAALKEDVGGLIERVRKDLDELQSRKAQWQEEIQGRMNDTEQDFQGLSQHVQEAQQALNQQLQQASESIGELHEAVDAARAELASKRGAWVAAMDELEQGATEETQRWVTGLESLLAAQTTAMIDSANKALDKHNETTEQLKAEFTEQAALQVAASLEPLRDSLERLASACGSRQSELEGRTRQSMDRLRALLPALDELKNVFESSGRLA